MGGAEVNAVIIGPQAEREFEFQVQKGFFWIGLPAEEIKTLGLTRIPDGELEFNGAEDRKGKDTYSAFGRFRGRGFNATIIATSIPIIGYEILEHLRFKVNPVAQQLQPAPEDEFAHPYIL